MREDCVQDARNSSNVNIRASGFHLRYRVSRSGDIFCQCLEVVRLPLAQPNSHLVCRAARKASRRPPTAMREDRPPQARSCSNQGRRAKVHAERSRQNVPGICLVIALSWFLTPNAGEREDRNLLWGLVGAGILSSSNLVPSVH